MPKPARAPTEASSRLSSYSLPPGPAVLTNWGIGGRSSVSSSRSASEVGADDQQDLRGPCHAPLRAKLPARSTAAVKHGGRDQEPKDEASQASFGSVVVSDRRPAFVGSLRAVAGGLCMIEKIGHELKRLAKVLGDHPSSQSHSGKKVAAQESQSAAAQLRDSLNEAQAALQATAQAKEAYSNSNPTLRFSSHWQPPADEAWRQLPAPACLGPEEVPSFSSEEVSPTDKVANPQTLGAVERVAMSTGYAALQGGQRTSRRGPVLPAAPHGLEVQPLSRRGLPEPPVVIPSQPRPGQLWYSSAPGPEPVSGESAALGSAARVAPGKIRRAGSTPATSTTATMSSGGVGIQSFSFATDVPRPCAQFEQGFSTRDERLGGNLDSLISDAYYAAELQSPPRAQQPAKYQTLLEPEPKLSLWELEERDSRARGKEARRPSPRSRDTPTLDVGLGTSARHRKNLGQRCSPESQRSKFEFWPSACGSSSSTRFEPKLRKEPAAAAAQEFLKDVHSLTSPRFPTRKVARSTSNVKKMQVGAWLQTEGLQPVTAVDEALVPMPSFMKQPASTARAHEAHAESFASSLAAPGELTAVGDQAGSAEVLEELLKAASGAPGTLEAALASVAKRFRQVSPSRPQRSASTPEPPWGEASLAPEPPWSWREDGVSTPSSWAGCQPESARTFPAEERTFLHQDVDRIRREQQVDQNGDRSEKHAETNHNHGQNHDRPKEHRHNHRKDEGRQDVPSRYRTLDKHEDQHGHERKQHNQNQQDVHERDSRHEVHRNNHDCEECRVADPEQDRDCERERRRRRRRSQDNDSSVPESRRSSVCELEESALQQADIQSLASTVQSSLGRHRHRKHRHEADAVADDASVSASSHRRHRSRRRAEREEEESASHAGTQLANEAQPGADAMAQTEAEAQQRRERREARRREREERSKAKHAANDRPALHSERPHPDTSSGPSAETRRPPKDYASSVASSGVTPTTKVPSSPGHYDEAPREEELVRGVERRWQEEVDSIRRQAQKHSKGSEAGQAPGRQVPSRYSDLDGCE
eukprot:TRINITY_DN3853_c0_g1_i1.p1 TRINITY_DN3853_c0_g1~~TRINITY_DN3853_c0_g1_i1.p1  ORF type:complete len:1070 (-),score=190.41 TRINITY_DN3853_c0_g1_i1:413-3547(-)